MKNRILEKEIGLCSYRVKSLKKKNTPNNIRYKLRNIYDRWTVLANLSDGSIRSIIILLTLINLSINIITYPIVLEYSIIEFKCTI